MQTVEWVNNEDSNVYKVKALGDIISPTLPYILGMVDVVLDKMGAQNPSEYWAVLSKDANRAGVSDEKFPSLEAAKSYVEHAIYLGLERGRV